MEPVKITALSKELGITSRTLRYYEEIGLINSIRPNFEKYRYFDKDNIERIRQIQVLRKMQIPIKEIASIYHSREMSTVVEVFTRRIAKIDDEINALSELRRIVYEFLDTMHEKGIKKISAIPLLYDEMEKRLERYDRLDSASEMLRKPVETSIVSLSPMAMISSVNHHTNRSEPTEFWNWLNRISFPLPGPGQGEIFEFQNDSQDTVIIVKVDEGFRNDGDYSEYTFEGGLFARSGVYVDDDLIAFHDKVIDSFDDNFYYEVDYTHDGDLRQPSLVESVLSADSKRDKVLIYVPVKKRIPNAALYDPNEIVEKISAREIEEANPVLWEKNVPLDGLEPINNPHYAMTEDGEAEFEVEYIGYISTRRLSTRVEAKLPFRVDVEFKVDQSSGRFGYGSDEGSVRIHHGTNLYGINMHNSADSELSEEALAFNQPIFGDYFKYPKRGRIPYDVYNRLTWIIGEHHFAAILNGEVRFCGINFPYMQSDLSREKPVPVILGSDGQGKRYFRKIVVSQLQYSPKLIIDKGVITMNKRQSNNMLPRLHQLITSEKGENYWFNGCAKYVMESYGEADYDYWFFSGITGDKLAQVYSYDGFRGDGVTDYRLSDGTGAVLEDVFSVCGYDSSHVTLAEIGKNRTMYVQTVMSYIDNGVAVILDHKFHLGWAVLVGYEEYGKTLLYINGDEKTPQKMSMDDLFTESLSDWEKEAYGLCFVGEKREEKDLKEIYRNTIHKLPELLTTKNDSYCFGAEAFRSWADEISRGRFDGMKIADFEGWGIYTIYVCNLATNGSCCDTFLDRALELNPDYTFLADVKKEYKKIARYWNNDAGKDLEALGGGFNVTLETLQDKEQREKIAGKILKMAVCMDNVVKLLQEGLVGEA
jgi:DNA-binding transcriptional MerR regulator